MSSSATTTPTSRRPRRRRPDGGREDLATPIDTRAPGEPAPPEPSAVSSTDERTEAVAVALPLPIRRAFAYLVPAGMDVPRPGTRVRVPFAERALTGVVLGA